MKITKQKTIQASEILAGEILLAVTLLLSIHRPLRRDSNDAAVMPSGRMPDASFITIFCCCCRDPKPFFIRAVLVRFGCVLLLAQ